VIDKPSKNQIFNMVFSGVLGFKKCAQGGWCYPLSQACDTGPQGGLGRTFDGSQTRRI
jgi:hypothetical protein